MSWYPSPPVRAVALLLLGAASALAAPPILPLEEVKPGMVGVGRSVFEGTRIDEFPFEVIDVMQSDGYNTSLILVRLSGELIDNLGGIAAGMSGSPLFVDGKLIGAVAFTTPNSDTRVGYATPIEDMLKVFDQETPDEPATAALPAGTPILAGGLRGRALAAVGRLMGRRGWRVIPSGRPAQATAAGDEDGPGAGLTEGSALAVSLTAGSVAMTAIGTLTYRDGDRILAFGHPFLKRGSTSLFLSEAFIYDTVWSAELPFKIGSPLGNPIGAVVQDREAGLAGRLGATADSFALSVEATDTTLGRSRRLTVDIVHDQALAPSLTAVVLMEAMGEVMDRDGGGTATIEWTIEADGLPEPLRLSDMLYSPEDLVGEAIGGPLFGLDALLRNDFAEVRPSRVTMTVSTSDEQRTARLVEATIEPATLRAGQPCRVTVTLQPFRAPAMSRELTFTVPAATAPGRYVLDLHGRLSAAGPLSQAALAAAGLAPPRDLPALLAALSATQRGNGLTAELLTPEAAEMRRTARELVSDQPPAEAFLADEPSTLPTVAIELGAGPVVATARAETMLDRVVLGRLQRSVEVVAP